MKGYRIRQFLVAGLAAALPLLSFAIVLGEPEVKTHIAQPLLMRMPVQDIAIEDGNVGAMRARVLSPEQHARHGLAAPSHPVHDLVVDIVQTGRASADIVIRSNAAVREPLVSLLVELRWGFRAIIRRVDLLLNPQPSGDVAPLWAGSPPSGPVAGGPELAQPGTWFDVPAPRPVLRRPAQQSELVEAAPVVALASLPNSPGPATGTTPRFSTPDGRFTLAMRFESLRNLKSGQAGSGTEG